MENIAVIIPSLDPDELFSEVVDGMAEAGFKHIIMVDDGSHSENKKYFQNALSRHPECTLLTHEVNRGKGRALKTAFAYISSNLPDVCGAVTVDGDGQHTPADAVRMAEKMLQHPHSIIFGCRNFNDSNIPLHNRLGNKITAGVFKLFFKMSISDAQTGLRAFPRDYLKELCDVEGERYEYESNMLMYMSEKQIPYDEISIKTIYIDNNQRSHFNVIKDSYRIYKPILAKAVSLKYLLSSLAGTVADSAVFTLLNAFFKNVSPVLLQTLLTTGAARLVSAFLNYTINYKWVFKSDASAFKSGTKYIITAVLQYAASWLLCSFAFGMLGIEGFARTLTKLLIDLILFFISYQIQKHWVFKK